MTRADRIERMLRKMESDREKNLSKLRGSAAGSIRRQSDEDARQRVHIFLIALAAVSDADLGTLEEELGLPRGDGAPPTRRRARRRPDF